MRSDKDLQIEVQAAIKELMHVANIHVSVMDGTVTLTGTVNSFVEKLAIERVAEKVVGVKAVNEKMEVMSYGFQASTDDDIRAEVLNIFKSHWDIPDDRIGVTVQDGRVSLEGKIKWHYQKDAATDAIISLTNAKSVSNNIVVDRNEI